jgi:hypothetical protein
MLKFFDVDPGWKKFGSGMEKSRIQDKHPGSATLLYYLSYTVFELLNDKRRHLELSLPDASVWATE